MKNVVCYILFIFCISLVNGQKTSGDYSYIAFEHYRNHRYDSAVFYFQKNSGTDPDCPTYWSRILGDCYTKLNKPSLAKKAYLTCMECNSEVDAEKRACCSDLADILMKEKKYKDAIAYYQKTKKYALDDGRFYPDYYVDYQTSIYYKNIGQLDSAIKCLSPFVFFSYGDDSITLQQRCRFYIKLLQEKYSNAEIKQELSKGEENILYFKTPDLKESVNSNLRFYHIESFFYFFGNKIYLFNGGYGSDLRNEKIFLKNIGMNFIINIQRNVL